MDDELKKKIDRLSEGVDRIIANPQDIRSLIKQGIRIEVVSSKRIDEIFGQRLNSAKSILDELPPIPDLFLPPAIATLYQEIRECILFGLNGAAITLSGILVEFTLKHTIFIFEIGGYGNYDPLKWDEFERLNFGNAISKARQLEFIDPAIADRLDAFRIDVRNPYSHYNIKNITKEVVAGNVGILNINTGEYERKDIFAKENPIIQAQVKPWVDSQKVLNVFRFADEIVEYLVTNLLNKLGKDT